MQTPETPSELVFSVVIVTRNRPHDLRRALKSCMAQSEISFEVLVYDDASTDETRMLVESEFPGVRYFRSDRHVDVFELRNQGFKDALGAYVVSIDDDAYFSTDQCLRQIHSKWQEHPDAGALAISYIEPTRSSLQKHMANIACGGDIRTFVACSASLRRECVLAVGGYRRIYVHQSAERDLCIRLLASGWGVVYVEVDPVIHLYSPIRDQRRLDYYGVRNTFLFDILNTPATALPGRLVLDLAGIIRHRFTLWSIGRKLLLIIMSLPSCIEGFFARSAVSRKVYHNYRSLPAHAPRPQRPTDCFDPAANELTCPAQSR